MIDAKEALSISLGYIELSEVEEQIRQACKRGFLEAFFTSKLSEAQIKKLEMLGFKAWNSDLVRLSLLPDEVSYVSWGHL